MLQPFGDASSEARCGAAFECLRALHGAGFAHGDARLPNLMADGAALRWVDLREAVAGAPHEVMRCDAATLAASVLRLKGPPYAFPAAVEGALGALGEPADGLGAYGALAVAVFKALQ